MSRSEMLEERESLRIQISLAEERGTPTAALVYRLEYVEQELSRLTRLDATSIGPKGRRRRYNG
jgi:hypothetical protein